VYIDNLLRQNKPVRCGTFQKKFSLQNNSCFNREKGNSSTTFEAHCKQHFIANNLSLQTTYISLNGLFADGPTAFECLV